MQNEIKPFTATDFASTVKDKVKTIILEALPEEQVNELINNEIKSFFQPRKENSYSDRMIPSEFSKMVEDICKKEIASHIEGTIADVVRGYWYSPGTQIQYHDNLKEQIQKLAPAFMQSYFEHQTANVLSYLHQQPPRNF